MDELLIKNAEEKLKKEAKSLNMNDVATLIQEKITDTLIGFCRQENEIAKAIINSKKTIYDCCKEITKDTKKTQHISDFDAYSIALKFYMPDMVVECSMTVKSIKKPSCVLKLSLSDLLE